MYSLISDAWKTRMQSSFSNEIRAYIDPRGIEYAPIGGTEAYYSAVAGDYIPGDYALSQCTYYTPLAFSYPITFECLFKPMFAHDVGADQKFFRWYSGTDSISFCYYEGSNQLGVKVNSGGTQTDVKLATAYITNGALRTWKRLTCVITAANITVYLNGAGAVSEARDMTAVVNMPFFFPMNGVLGYMSYALIIPGLTATASDITTFYKNALNEQIYFPFQLNAVGRTRCDVTKYVGAYNTDESAEFVSSSCGISLRSVSGEFCADQYATFEPQSGSYNGTAAQKYLANDIGLSLLQMSGDYTLTSDPFFEYNFSGVIPNGTFSRSTSWGGLGTISTSANDYIKVMGTRIIRKAQAWENYYLSRVTPASNSILHELLYLAIKRSVYNFAGNSGFQNLVIGWTADIGTTLDWSADHPLIGTQGAKLNGASGIGMYQYLEADFNIGDTYTFQIYAYAEAAQTITIKLQEAIGSTSVNFSHNGLGWMLVSVTHSIVDSGSTQLEFHVNTTGTLIYFDCAMVTYGGIKYYYIQNDYDPTSVAAKDTDAVEGKYAEIGIVSEDVSYVHPWAVVKQEENVWSHLKSIADSCGARLMRITKAGYMIFKTTMVTPLTTTPVGVLPKASGLSMNTESRSINKLTVRGVHIIKEERGSYIWSAKASGIEDDNAGDDMFKVTLTPAPVQYYPGGADQVLECLYGLDDSTVLSNSNNEVKK